jgi:hypothetical protein
MSDLGASGGSEERIVLNGISGVTGEYLMPPLTLAEAAAAARGTPPPVEKKKAFEESTGRFSFVPLGTDENDLEQAGWGVVFTPSTSAAVREGLKPLLELRRTQAKGLYKELEYRPGESAEAFLARYDASIIDVDPDKAPLYLMFVGGPEAIPFEVQFLLDIGYSVGRVAFDREGDYGHYAQAVKAYETAAKVANAREVVYWGTRHDADAATQLSADSLVGPLFNGVPATDGSAERKAIAKTMQFTSRCLLGDDATKANLLEALHPRGKAAPSLLFTASHGMGGWPKGDPKERTVNGALLCQDWPGFGRIKPEHYLTAAEIEPNARFDGVVAFVFACYGAGTPQYDPFLKKAEGGPVEVAAAPFVSALGQRLLAGGALAVVGHVERAWAFSIKPSKLSAKIDPFRNFIGRALSGDRVGKGPFDFSQRYAAYSAALLRLLDPSLPEARKPTDRELAVNWIERNDAQNYIILGDPAVRLRVDDLK